MSVTFFYILVFTDCLTKMYHYEPTASMEIKEAADIFYQTVFRLHSLSKATILD